MPIAGTSRATPLPVLVILGELCTLSAYLKGIGRPCACDGGASCAKLCLMKVLNFKGRCITGGALCIMGCNRDVGGCRSQLQTMAARTPPAATGMAQWRPTLGSMAVTPAAAPSMPFQSRGALLAHSNPQYFSVVHVQPCTAASLCAYQSACRLYGTH